MFVRGAGGYKGVRSAQSRQMEQVSRNRPLRKSSARSAKYVLAQQNTRITGSPPDSIPPYSSIDAMSAGGSGWGCGWFTARTISRRGGYPVRMRERSRLLSPPSGPTSVICVAEALRSSSPSRVRWPRGPRSWRLEAQTRDSCPANAPTASLALPLTPATTPLMPSAGPLLSSAMPEMPTRAFPPRPSFDAATTIGINFDSGGCL